MRFPLMLKRLSLALAALVLLSSSAAAQANLTATTISVAANGSDGTVFVTSSTGITAGMRVYVDKELMTVVSVPVAGTLNVARGVAGQASAHEAGAAVFAGTLAQFYTVDAVGACTPASVDNPYINVNTGKRYVCVDTAWVELTAGAVFCRSVTTVQTAANLTETDLFSCTLPANVLAMDGRGIRVTAFGSFGATANNKSLRIYFGATNIGGITTASNGGAFQAVGIVMRTGVAAEISERNYLIQSTSNDVGVSAALTIDLTGAVIVRVTGQNGTAAAGDIVFRGAFIEFLAR